MSVALAEPWAEAARSLGESGMKRAGDLARSLEQPDRQKRAEALARELAAAALDVEELELTWG